MLDWTGEALGAMGQVALLLAAHGLAARIVGVAILLVAILAGMVLTLYGGPGTWVVLGASAAFMWWAGTPYFWVILLTMIGVAGLAEVVEFVAASRGVQRRGGSRRAGWGTLLGGVLGAVALTIPVPIIGTIIGAVVGSFGGAFLMELTVAGRANHSAGVGLAAAAGRLLAAVWKLMTVVLMGAGALYPIVLCLRGQ